GTTVSVDVQVTGAAAAVGEAVIGLVSGTAGNPAVEVALSTTQVALRIEGTNVATALSMPGMHTYAIVMTATVATLKRDDVVIANAAGNFQPLAPFILVLDGSWPPSPASSAQFTFDNVSVTTP